MICAMYSSKRGTWQGPKNFFPRSPQISKTTTGPIFILSLVFLEFLKDHLKIQFDMNSTTMLKKIYNILYHKNML